MVDRRIPQTFGIGQSKRLLVRKAKATPWIALGGDGWTKILGRNLEHTVPLSTTVGGATQSKGFVYQYRMVRKRYQLKKQNKRRQQTCQGRRRHWNGK